MRRLLALFSLTLCACGNGGFEAPTCAEGETRVRGSLDGMDGSEVSASAAGYAFINALGEDNGSLDITTGGVTVVRLEWPELVANGRSVSARGQVDFSAQGGISAGNCETGDFTGVMKMNEEGGGGTFLLTDLRMAEPYCEAEPVSGELTGCFRSPPGP